MSCKRILAHIDEYLDGDLADQTASALTTHVEGCPECSQHLARERALRAALRNYPVSGPSEGFFERALETAARPSRPKTRRWRLGIGGALAAGLAVWLVTGLLMKTPELPPSDGIPGLTIAMHETRTVNLVFSSAEELNDARLTVQLPPGIELEGFSGRQEVRWKTSLQKGKNVLPLKVIALGDEGGELIARLDHQTKHKTFRVRVTVM